ncbi:Neuraminidase [Penicillium taxi]|uniref:Neuraminidase n=1 Tax=Penicillium taxi TaxID=168475 RepID=UPI0025453A94|nr:Neuraminidase [Penicillium taxi]KAJ5908049.1 Neuraminidase [Penicillium taxi]
MHIFQQLAWTLLSVNAFLVHGTFSAPTSSSYDARALHRQSSPLVVLNDERLVCSATHGGTYPRLAKLSDGTILSSFTRHLGHHRRSLGVARSTDGGRTFSDFGEVTQAVGDVDNMFLLEVSKDVVLASFRNHDKDPDGKSTHYRITVCRSEDGGRTWKFASQATEKRAPLGLWEPFMRLGNQGEVQLTFSQEYAHDNQCTMRVVSRDQGNTWTAPACLSGTNVALRDGMNGITKTFDDNGIAKTSDDGRDALVMVFETNRHGTFNIEALISYNDGSTWTSGGIIFRPQHGHNAGAPQIASFLDGSMVVVFMTDEDSDEVQWPKHASIKAVFSSPPKNGQMVWSAPTLISSEPSFWPGVTSLDSNSAMAVYDRGGMPFAKTIKWNSK